MASFKDYEVTIKGDFRLTMVVPAETPEAAVTEAEQMFEDFVQYGPENIDAVASMEVEDFETEVVESGGE